MYINQLWDARYNVNQFWNTRHNVNQGLMDQLTNNTLTNNTLTNNDARRTVTFNLENNRNYYTYFEYYHDNILFFNIKKQKYINTPENLVNWFYNNPYDRFVFNFNSEKKKFGFVFCCH